MVELVSAIATYALWLYLLLGLLMFRELRTMWRSGTERDQAVFGLEREAAASRAVRSLVTLLLLVTIAAGVYTIANVIAPTLPQAALQQLDSAPIVAEPPPVPFAADTATPTATATSRLPRIVTAAPTAADGLASATPPPAVLCRDPALQIESPGPGAVLTAAQPVVVSVRFPAGEGWRFRLALGAGDAPTTWRALGGEHAEPVSGAAVETLSPAGLTPGVYSLRLELVAADGTLRPDGTCTVPLRVP